MPGQISQIPQKLCNMHCKRVRERERESKREREERE